MELILEVLFRDQVKKCPADFKNQIVFALEQIQASINLKDLEGIKPIGRNKEHYKLEIDKSKIGLKVKNKQVTVTCFIFNQFS